MSILGVTMPYHHVTDPCNQLKALCHYIVTSVTTLLLEGVYIIGRGVYRAYARIHAYIGKRGYIGYTGYAPTHLPTHLPTHPPPPTTPSPSPLRGSPVTSVTLVTPLVIRFDFNPLPCNQLREKVGYHAF